MSISRVVTLNYGTHLKWALRQHRRYVEIIQPDDIELSRSGDDVVIARLLGTVEEPDSLVVDMDGFANFETEKAPLIDFTRKELLAGRAVVLVNCDPHNKYFQVVLDCLLKGSSADNQPRFCNRRE